MVDFIKFVKLQSFSIGLYGVWQNLPHAIQTYAKWLKFNDFYKINGLQLGIHTLNLSCLGN